MTSSLNSFGSKSTLDVEGRSLTYYSLKSDALVALGVDRLPYSIKVLLENLLRHEDGVKVTRRRHRGARALGRDTRRATARPPATTPRRSPSPPSASSCRTSPACRRSWTSPSMRDAIIALGGDPEQDQPPRARRARDRPLGDPRALRHRRRASSRTSRSSTSATSSATRS